jgi:hypothetical protein
MELAICEYTHRVVETGSPELHGEGDGVWPLII